MAENRSIVRDIIVGLVTTSIGFGGAWYLQERSRVADLERQKQAAIEAAEQQKAEFDLKVESERTLRAESNTLALYGEWLSPEIAARRAQATALIRSSGTANYARIMADPLITDDAKFALNDTLQYFARARTMAEAHELDVAKARGLFGPPAAWWSETGLPRLMAGWDEAEDGALPGELINAAYGLAVLGGDVQRLAPPLDLEQVGYYVGLGPSGGGRQGAYAPTTSLIEKQRASALRPAPPRPASNDPRLVPR